MHIFLYKDTFSHTCIAGNKCAEAIAKYQVSQTDKTQLTPSYPTETLTVTPFLALPG